MAARVAVAAVAAMEDAAAGGQEATPLQHDNDSAANEHVDFGEDICI